MMYCGNTACLSTVWKCDSDGAFCQGCGQELTPCIQCLCGKNEYNPRTPKYMPTYCGHCGKQFTEAYLSECMRQQLGQMVNKIAAKQTAMGSFTD